MRSHRFPTTGAYRSVGVATGRRGLCLVTIAATLADGSKLSVPVLLRGIPHWRKGKGRKNGGDKGAPNA